MEKVEKENKYYNLFEINSNDKSLCGPFADSTNILEDVVSFISIELLDHTRVFQWFSPNATLGHLFQFVYAKINHENIDNIMENPPVKYNFYLQDKEVKNDNKYIKFTPDNQSKKVREFLSPINTGSTRNRYSLKVLQEKLRL